MIKTLLSFVTGVIVGVVIMAFVFGPHVVKAQYGGTKAYVTHFAVGSGEATVPGKQVVGISCVRQSELANSECYVVSQ